MNQTSFPFQPSRFASLRATTPVPVSWETIVNELTGPFHKAQTELYRQTIARLHQAEQDNDNLLLPKLKAEKEQIKQAQPAFIASVSLTGGRTSAHITGYSGVIMVDIDDIPPGNLPRHSPGSKPILIPSSPIPQSPVSVSGYLSGWKMRSQSMISCLPGRLSMNIMSI